jgi:hypothetical protein
MSHLGDGFYSLLVTTLFASLLVLSGVVGVVLAIALMGCGVYRARSSVRLPRDRTSLHRPVMHA